MKKKRKYKSPQAIVEIFRPEESVSSCYEIACEYGAVGGENGIHAPEAFTIEGTMIPGDKRVDDIHGKKSGGTGCGWAKNQIVEIGPDGKVDSLKEINVLNFKTMDCNIVKQVGDTVYWTTQSGNSRLWSHKGRIGHKSSSHPNMS